MATTVPNIATATSITQTSPSTYSATLSSEWCIGSVPHGGYAAATINRAVALHFSTTLSSYAQPDLLTAHYEYIRRTSAAPATISISPLKLGRQTSTVYVTLSQTDNKGQPRDEIAAFITHANIGALSGASFDTRWALRDPPRLPKPTNLRDTAVVDPHWMPPVKMPFSAFRKASNRVRWLLPRQDSPAVAAFRRAGHSHVLDMWMGMATRDAATGQYERFTTPTLGFAADMFPQTVEIIKDPGLYTRDPASDKSTPTASFWFPTLLMNIEVKRALPEPGVEWLFMRVAAREVRNGRYDLDVSMFDEEGNLVALSQHVVFALSAERNLAQRGSYEDKKGKL